MPALATLSAELRFSFEFLRNLKKKKTTQTQQNPENKPYVLVLRTSKMQPWTAWASKICLRVLNCAVMGSHDSPNSTKSPSGNGRYFQTNTWVPAFSKLANIKVTMEGCLKITAGNAVDPEQPPTALQLLQTDIHIISCSDLFIGCKNGNLHYNSAQHQTWPVKTLKGSKPTQINPSIDLARGHTTPLMSFLWNRGDLVGGTGWGDIPWLHRGQEESGQHIHHLPLLSPAPKKSHLKPHDSSWELRYCLFVCSRDKTNHERLWHYPKLVFLMLL